MINFCDINVYVINKVFEYCSENDLENLYLVCRLFQDIIENRIYYKKSLSLLLTGHQSKNEKNNCTTRTFDKLTYRDRMRISENWINGRYDETVFFHHRKWYPSKILVEQDLFYMSHAGAIRIHRRSNTEIIERKFIKEISENSMSDVACFVKKDQTLFGGRICGSCFIYEDDYVTEQRLHGVKEYLNAVDFHDDIYVSSTDKTSKLWTKSIELGLINLELVKDYKESYKCLKISSHGDKITCGKYTDLKRRALREIDVETGIQRICNSNSLSIYDLVHKTDDVVFTANFDTTFRIFDKRSDKDESIWSDPYDSSVYCLEYDGLYGVLCGMKHHCRVNLYDIRVPKKFIQMFFPSLRRTHGSPVYSLSCDCRHLFVATDHNLRAFDFKADWAACRDYRNIFVNI